MTPFDPSKSPDENWRGGEPLNDAWFNHASDELTDQYRDARNSSAGTRAFVAGMMETEVRLKIADGELLAFGIQTAATPDNSATPIPAAFFQAESVAIDWERSELNGLGRSFSDVRVCFVGTGIGETDVSKNPPPKAAPSLEKRGGGRTNKYPDARDVLEVLHRNPVYARLSAAKLLDIFNAKYIEMFELPDVKVAKVCVRSLQTYLTAFRQELAKTGNRDFAN